MDIKIGEHRMAPGGRVWRITRLNNPNVWARTPDDVLEEREREFIARDVLQWPVVQIQRLTKPTFQLLPCPFCRARAQQVPFTASESVRCRRCGANIHAKTEDVVIQRWNTRAEPDPSGLRWEFDEETLQLLVMIPSVPKPIRCPFARLDIQMLGTSREDYLRLFVRCLNAGMAKVDPAKPVEKPEPEVEWQYQTKTQTLVARVEDGDSYEIVGCQLMGNHSVHSERAVNLAIHHLKATVTT